ncbi:hypothetical protein ACFL6X_03865 [Candidatus Latescibacterota bacterium]
MRVLNELDELGIEDVAAWLEDENGKKRRDLGMAVLGRTRNGLARRGSAFLVAPAEPAPWAAATGRRILLRLEEPGVRHELWCRVAGKARLAALGLRRLGLEGRALYRLVPAGVIVTRELRDMMRFYVGEARRSPAGTTDARRFVDLQARLQVTDVDVTDARRLRPRLHADALHTLDPAPLPGARGEVPATEPASSPGCAAEVIDFSGSGLRVETGLSSIAGLMQLGDSVEASEVLHQLGDRVLLVAVAVRFQFPPAVADLEPPVPQHIWLLAEAARVSLLEGDSGEEDRVRLGLAFLYQAQEVDEATGSPQFWQMIRGQGEAGDFVVIHGALNQAAARIQSDSPSSGAPR